MTKIEISIIFALNQCGEIHGTETLMEIIGITDLRKKPRVSTAIALLLKNGYVIVEPSLGGRGNKTIYRNTPKTSMLFQVQR